MWTEEPYGQGSRGPSLLLSRDSHPKMIDEACLVDSVILTLLVSVTSYTRGWSVGRAREREGRLSLSGRSLPERS